MLSVGEVLLKADPVADLIVQHLPRHAFSSGKFRFNCPLCVARGEARPDQRQRCAVWVGAVSVGYSCFNCSAKGKYEVGGRLSKAMQELMSALGVPEVRIMAAASRAATTARMTAGRTDLPLPSRLVSQPIAPVTASLPPGARPLLDWIAEECQQADLWTVAKYLISRGDDIATATPYYWTPLRDHDLNLRLIVPYLSRGRVVGWTARAAASCVMPKYWSSAISQGFMFNGDVLSMAKRKFVIVTEGP
ncbi:hypothetical protein, partial [Falsiroseomonas tokyonensis]